MGVDVEFAQRFNGIAKELETHRQRRLPRIKIDNSAANGELAAGSDLGNTLITGVGEFLENAFHRCGICALQLERRRYQLAALGRGLIEAGARGDNDARSRIAFNQRKKGETLSRNFRIGQNVFDSGEFGFRKK